MLKPAAFEAQTFLIATLRQSVDRTDDMPKKIAFAERTQRLQALQAALTGVDIKGELEPSHGLLDRACNTYENISLKYLELATCVSRSLEVQGTTKNRELTSEKGSLILKSGDDKLQSPTDSEIKVHYAMVRRGLAYQFARLMSYSQHCEWESFLFDSVHREAPPGCHRPSLAQILQCDKAAWSRLASTVSDVRQQADGSYPWELRFWLCEVTQLGQSTNAAASSSRPQPYASQKPQQSKGGGRGKKKSPPVPAELRGKWFKTSAGEPLCYDFNCSSGCPSKVAAGERCGKGWHLCRA